MQELNFNHWLARRQNQLDEGLFDWLWKKKPQFPHTERPGPTDPQEIDKEIYSNPLVNRYVEVVLRHLGIQQGAQLVKLDRQGKPAGTETVTDWSTMNPEFYRALQRFIAAHILGQGESKSYLRISHYDAITILNQLNELSYGNDRPTIADELGIDGPEALSNWLQSKVPAAYDAVRQKGFQQGAQDYLGSRIARGKGNPLGHPEVKNLVKAGQEVVRQGIRRTRGSLYKALVNLDAELRKITGQSVEPIEPVRRKKPEPGDEGEIPGPVKAP